jgi:cell division protein ZapA
MSKLKIHLVIGAYRFPMNIDRTEEEIYRNAEKQVNKYIEDYQKQYPRISGEEILSLVSLRLAIVIFKMEMNQDIEPVIEKIQSLDKELKQLLDNE